MGLLLACAAFGICDFSNIQNNIFFANVFSWVLNLKWIALGKVYTL
jgi:hypothetical protein